jgi:hypothetical protein
MDAVHQIKLSPFKGFLAALHCIQAQFPADLSPIRTALVTARSAPAHERVVRTNMLCCGFTMTSLVIKEYICTKGR